jgi:hypothetical protein
MPAKPYIGSTGENSGVLMEMDIVVPYSKGALCKN